jgi:hypothetical protein
MGEKMQRPDSEVEPVEDSVSGEQDAYQHIPDGI